MSFIQREIDRIQAALVAVKDERQYQELYAAQQALAWVLEPIGMASPAAVILGTPEAQEGCWAEPHPAPFSGTRVQLNS